MSKKKSTMKLSGRPQDGRSGGKSGEKVKLGLLGLMPLLYERGGPKTRQTQDAFARKLAASWDWAEVVYPGVCNTRQQVDAAVRSFHAERCDGVVVVCLTYAPSLISASALLETPLPVVLLDTQPDADPHNLEDEGFLTRNHGVHGIQDLANVLARGGMKPPILVGHWRDHLLITNLCDWARAAKARSLLRQMRTGLIGRPMAGMGDFAVDEAALLMRIGPEIVPVEPRRIAELAAAADPKAIGNRIAENQRTFDISDDLTAAQHEAAVRTSLALEAIMREDELDALAAHFLTISEDGRVPTLPFLAASKLLADGYGYAGEGDVCCASLTAAMQRVAGPADFVEMFSMDFTGEAVVMAHMGEGNYATASLGRKGGRKPRLVPRPFPLAPTPEAPATPVFAPEPGLVTIASLAIAAEAKFRLVIAAGVVAEWGPFEHVRHPHFKFEPAADLDVFLSEWSHAGGSHHQVMVRGDQANLLLAVADVLKIDAQIVADARDLL